MIIKRTKDGILLRRNNLSVVREWDGESYVESAGSHSIELTKWNIKHPIQTFLSICKLINHI